VVARKTLPANDLAALVAWLKANPDKASAGTGRHRRAGAHIRHLLQKMTDTRFAFIPYRGTGPALRDLMAGRST